MWKHIAANALTLLIVLLFLAAGAILWGVGRYSAPGPLTAAICLRVEPGANMRGVSDDLAEQGAITSPALFRMGVDYAGLSGDLKQGSFLISEGTSMAEVADIITRGGQSTCGTEIVYRVGIARVLAEVRELDPATDRFVELAQFNPATDPVPPEYADRRERPDTRFRIAVAEGVTSWQVMTALNSLDVLDGDVTVVPAEGALAPDSYEVTPGTPVADVLARMESAQAQILAEEWAERGEDVPVSTPEEAMVLASIIEKETAIAEERPLVSSVLVNRIRQGMRLQFDPTIIYGITRGIGILDRPISNADIDGRTEAVLHGEIAYNTYQIDGLPAGPIANPGRAAIEAALNPAQTDLLFFVADGTGGHAFAATLEEHNANVARLREIEAQAPESDG
jgi:UPF0755 protein